jgi:hypothetical protein
MKDLKAHYNRIKREQFPWCYEVTKCTPELVFRSLRQAFENYWHMKKEPYPSSSILARMERKAVSRASKARNATGFPSI